MAVTRDTSADEAAALLQSQRPGAGAPGISLDGIDAERVRGAIRDARDELLEIEKTTKEYRRYHRVRMRRAMLDQVLRLLAPR